MNHMHPEPRTALLLAGSRAWPSRTGYANNCWCNEGTHPFARPYYEGNAKATVGYGFDAIKVDSCGPSTNITAWREALDAAAAAAGRPRVQMENCRNYACEYCDSSVAPLAHSCSSYVSAV